MPPYNRRPVVRMPNFIAGMICILYMNEPLKNTLNWPTHHWWIGVFIHRMVGVLVRFGCTVSWLPGSPRNSHGYNLFKTAPSSGARYGGGGEGLLGQKLVRPIFFWTN